MIHLQDCCGCQIVSAKFFALFSLLVITVGLLIFTPLNLPAGGRPGRVHDMMGGKSININKGAIIPHLEKRETFTHGLQMVAFEQSSPVTDAAVDEWMARLDKILRLGDANGPQLLANATASEELLQEVKLLKIIRKLDDNSNKGPISNEKDKAGPPLSVEIQSDCGVHGRWAVITSIAAKLTRTMEVLLEQNWCLVVVGDVGSPKYLPAPAEDKRLVYLSMQDQARLPFNLVPLTPTKNIGRKNLGYLFAMSQGAKVILDMDDDNEPIPIQGSDEVHLPVETAYAPYDRPYLYRESLFNQIISVAHINLYSTVYFLYVRQADEIPVWNPYPYFNLRYAWPRGYPWEYLPFQDMAEHSMTRKQWCKPIIQQYLANLDPDLDAAYRMKFKLPMDYRDGTFRRVVMPRNVWAPYNAQATVHLPQAFWSLMLPVTVNERVSDIWRSYVTQSLLHLVPEACLMFTSPAVKHTRNPHNYTTDFIKELPLYSQAASLIHLIRNLPLIVDDFQGAFLKVYEILYQTGVVELGDYQYAQAWFSDLLRIGVPLPDIPGKNTWMRQTRLCINFHDSEVATKVLPEIISKYLPLFQNAIVFLERSTLQALNSSAFILSQNSSSTLLNYLDAFPVNSKHWPGEVKFHWCNSSKGTLQTRCVRQCLAHADGKPIMYMNDDDYFNMARAEENLRKDKIWYAPVRHINGSSPYNETALQNLVWPHGGNLTTGARALHKIPMEIKQAYLDHVASTGKIETDALADCIYVPPQYQEKLLAAIDQFEQLQPDLFHEVSLTWSVNLVAPGDQKYTFHPTFTPWGNERVLPGVPEDQLPWAMHFHPIKMSSPHHRAVWRDTMALQYARLVVCDQCKCCDRRPWQK